MGAHLYNCLYGLLRVLEQIVVPGDVALGEHGNHSRSTVLEITHLIALLDAVAWVGSICVLDSTNQQSTDKHHSETLSVTISLEGSNSSMVLSKHIQFFLDSAGVDCNERMNA